ncbi:hypothetical protein K440DRAFT_611332 [Wilcoxina mikolae CBS 423.85]|nr:hypothetical protein K440DRAFT_611332 [Wilcoxina mikolae CBS 423.85]
MWLLLLILFLKLGMPAAVLAHAGSHCVTGIALPPVDAKLLSLLLWPLRERTRKEVVGCVG